MFFKKTKEMGHSCKNDEPTKWKKAEFTHLHLREVKGKRFLFKWIFIISGLQKMFGSYKLETYLVMQGTSNDVWWIRNNKNDKWIRKIFVDALVRVCINIWVVDYFHVNFKKGSLCSFAFLYSAISYCRYRNRT